MNSFRLPRRRHRVVLRPRERARRAKLVAAGGAVLLLGGLAAASARHAVSALAKLKQTPLFAAPESVVVESPNAAFLAAAQPFVDAAPGSPAEKAAALKEKFPCVADVRIRRAWGEKRASLVPELRSAVAPARRAGKDAGWLAATGEVFPAPAGAYSVSGPAVEPGAAPLEERRALAREWPELSRAGAFPAPLSLFAWSDSASWEARLEDGTVVHWGRMGWTAEKLSRLAQALADARAKEPGVFSADLRYFEDGKVLLKLVRPASVARGGLK